MRAATAFDVIPVIDLREGRVVRAIAGRRKHYRPLQTPLSATSDPLDVAGGLQALYPFQRLYVADLDAIAGFAPSRGVIESLSSQCAGRELWVDSGARTRREVAELLAIPRVSAVIGSETGIEPAEVEAIGREFPGRIILSLDFRETGFIGDARILQTPACWPARIIGMTLARVGAAAGPDLKCLESLQVKKPDAALYAAGGVRSRADLTELQRMGISGALVSTALHAGTITAGDLIEITGR